MKPAENEAPSMDGNPASRCLASPPRRLVTAIVLAVCLLLVLHAFALEAFQVPSGSMAPALLGHHREVICPRCGFPAVVGRGQGDRDGHGGQRCYAKAACPNCGCHDLSLSQAPETSGDHILVDKACYAWRRPRRWEVIVFRLFGKVFVKRVIGLPGEQIELVDGDVYVHGSLARKTFDQARAMRVLIFDNDFAPGPDGWACRWEGETGASFASAAEIPSGPGLHLDGRTSPRQLRYRPFSLDDQKCRPIHDEYGYNAGLQAAPETVHDFLVEAEVEVVAGMGKVTLALNDGHNWAETILPVGEGMVNVRIRNADQENEPGPGKEIQLWPGKRYHIDMALVDRRLTCRVDGRDVFTPLDLPPARERREVIHPLRFAAEGVEVRWHHVRLYRDVHYSQAGTNAVHGRSVPLGVDQTFVLGDNSASSEDSRFWPNQGAVPLDNLVGRAVLVHLPSRTVTWPGLGKTWRWQLPDWGKMRWVR